MKQNWTYKKFGEAFVLQMGKTPSRDNDDFWGGENIWVSIADLKDKYIEESKEHITDIAVLESGINKVYQGTVIMSFKLTIGRAAITKCDLYTNEAIMSFVPKEKNAILSDYIYYYLKGCKWTGTNKAVMGQTLNKKTIAENIFAYPPIAEQHRIVSELDLLQSIIDKQQAQLKELDTLAQSIFYDMFGDPVENGKGWETDNLKTVAPQKQYNGIVPSTNGKFWLLNLDMVEQQTGSIIEKVLWNQNEIGNSTIIFDTTNVLYSKLRPYLNKVVLPDEIGYGTSELVPLKPNTDVLDRVFFAYLLRSKSFVDYISVKVAGAKMPRVSMDILRDFLVILPPLPFQQSFAAKIESIEKQKAAIRQSLVETQKLFDYTMDKYFG